jgi:3,4-dihydroxy 2-butanone 4-phosphate synthase/GTP cyclohydrolase II
MRRRADHHRPSAPPPREVAAVPIPTPYGLFQLRAFESASGLVYLALLKGTVPGRGPTLTRLHSECLTGDVLGSLRCDCGVQLRAALRTIAAEGNGVLLYLTGQEGRGIGLVNKLRSYLEQDLGADTVDANLRLGLAVDARDYSDAARVLAQIGVRSVLLLSNNPRKALALERAGIVVSEMHPLATAAHIRNRAYLNTKRVRLGHHALTGAPLADTPGAPMDVGVLLGTVRAKPDRPYVLVKYAQTLDGRIATATGDSKWISGEAERRISHALRSACDAVMVGAGTVATDDPQLTVRMVPGASPLRVVLDSTIRTPLDAQVFSGDAATMVIASTAADAAKVAAARAAGAAVSIARPGPGGVDITDGLRLLRAAGVASLLVEGGAGVITSLLRSGAVDRLVVSVSPTIIGAGVEAVGSLGVTSIAAGIRLTNRSVHLAGDDLLLAWDVVSEAPSGPTSGR